MIYRRAINLGLIIFLTMDPAMGQAIAHSSAGWVTRPACSSSIPALFGNEAMTAQPFWFLKKVGPHFMIAAAALMLLTGQVALGQREPEVLGTHPSKIEQGISPQAGPLSLDLLIKRLGREDPKQISNKTYDAMVTALRVGVSKAESGDKSDLDRLVDAWLRYSWRVGSVSNGTSNSESVMAGPFFCAVAMPGRTDDNKDLVYESIARVSQRCLDESSRALRGEWLSVKILDTDGMRSIQRRILFYGGLYMATDEENARPHIERERDKLRWVIRSRFFTEMFLFIVGLIVVWRAKAIVRWVRDGCFGNVSLDHAFRIIHKDEQIHPYIRSVDSILDEGGKRAVGLSVTLGDSIAQWKVVIQRLANSRDFRIVVTGPRGAECTAMSGSDGLKAEVLEILGKLKANPEFVELKSRKHTRSAWRPAGMRQSAIFLGFPALVGFGVRLSRMFQDSMSWPWLAGAVVVSLLAFGPYHWGGAWQKISEVNPKGDDLIIGGVRYRYLPYRGKGERWKTWRQLSWQGFLFHQYFFGVLLLVGTMPIALQPLDVILGIPLLCFLFLQATRALNDYNNSTAPRIGRPLAMGA